MTTHVQQTLRFPLVRWAPMQPATIDPTLDLCTRYPLWLGLPRQCGIQSLPETSTHGQHWESNPRPLLISARGEDVSRTHKNNTHMVQGSMWPISRTWPNVSKELGDRFMIKSRSLQGL